MDRITAGMTNGWLRRIERDVMALGSPVFYFLVIGRGLVGPFWDLVVPLVAIGAALMVGQRWLRDADLYLSRGLVLGVLITNHYGDALFGAFAAATFGFMVFAAQDLGRSRRAIVRGVLVGAGGAIIGCALAVPFA